MTQSDDPRLTAYVLGELDDAGREEFEQSLQQSAELREEVDAIRKATALLNDSLQAEPCPSLTSEQRAEIQGESAAAVVTLPDRPVASRGRNRWP